jgi:hypothetical protein
LSNNQRLSPWEIIAVQDIILEYILSNEWKDHKDFARALSEKILRLRPLNRVNLQNILSKFVHPFFSFNNVPRKEFVERFPVDAIIHRMSDFPDSAKIEIRIVTPKQTGSEKSNISLEEIFPEIKNIDIEIGKSLVNSLDIYERIIQDALRDALREKNATNIFERKSDSSLEIADIEDFTLRIREKAVSFSAVVKGYKSVGKSTVVFEDIAHQILKANDTHPDHILLILAKPLGDSVVSNLVRYGKDCGNRNLVITMDPVNLARFLRIRGII